MKFTKRKDGRYVKNITDKNGKRIFIYGKTPKEVTRKILEYQEKKELGPFFTDIANEWWNIAEKDLSYQSKSSYEVAIKRLCEEFEKIRIKEIKPKDIQAFIYKLADKNFAKKTISNYKMVCNRIFEYAVLENEIEYNPCSSVKLPKNLKTSKRSSATNEEELKILKLDDVWLFPIIALLSGLRKGEILALQWKDINFSKNIINVSKSIYYEGNVPKIKCTKTDAGTRTVPLLSLLKENLLKQKNINPKHFIICDEKGNPITKKAFRYKYSKFQKQFDIKCTAHQLRHSFATNAFEADVPAKSVQEILGHKQLSTTMDIYTDFREKSFESAAALLNKNFDVKK